MNSYWGLDSATRLLTPSGGLLSKQLDAISRGWPPCLHALAVTAALVTEADKLTLEQELTVWISHSILTLMECKGNYWLTNSIIPEYAI
jgi:hypothetical protein